jgi:hypothetical protein
LLHTRLFVYTQKDSDSVAPAPSELKALNPVTSTLLNHQVSLAEASSVLVKEFESFMKDLD